jgi:hypothetical protein
MSTDESASPTNPLLIFNHSSSPGEGIRPFLKIPVNQKVNLPLSFPLFHITLFHFPNLLTQSL